MIYGLVSTSPPGGGYGDPVIYRATRYLQRRISLSIHSAGQLNTADWTFSSVTVSACIVVDTLWPYSPRKILQANPQIIGQVGRQGLP